MPGDAIQPRDHDWRDRLWVTAIGFAGNAAFPRLSHRLRWPSRLGPRGLAAYVAFNTLLHFAVRKWVFPTLRRMAAERERARQALREQLRREPTDDEIRAHPDALT